VINSCPPKKGEGNSEGRKKAKKAFELKPKRWGWLGSREGFKIRDEKKIRPVGDCGW
jgi:hypothetical protein